MVEELRTLVIYDIVDDRIRGRVAETCLDFGLLRIQYSAFAGRLNRNKREELFLKLCDKLGNDAGKILLQPICAADVGQMLLRENERPADDGA
jgi:CRISPR-associated protein Cas2